MANADRPKGFRPAGRVRSSKSYVAGGTVYPGDAVKMSNAGVIVAASASDALMGVAANYATSGVAVTVWDDPDQEFEVQADEAEVDAQTDVGLNYNIVATAGSSAYKMSRMELDSSTQATDSTLPLRLVGIVRAADNAGGANARCRVKINVHQLRQASEGL